MSIDTENKRRSATGLSSVFTVLPIPDGSILVVDRASVAHVYSGVFESTILPIELTANNISSTTSVGAPAIGQVHGLSATGVSSASSVGTPTIRQKHTLTPTNISSASSVGQPAIGQVHALTSTDISSTSAVSNPVIGQVHDLIPASISSAASVGTPRLNWVATITPSFRTYSILFETRIYIIPARAPPYMVL